MMLEHYMGRGALMAVVLGLPLGGCYTGFQEFGGDDPPPSDSAGEDDAADGEAEDDGEGDDGNDGGVQSQCLDAPRQIGATSLRRLTQSQYRNTIRDLLGLEADMVEGFTADEKVGPFKSNAVAPVVDLQVEHYMDAAEILAEEYVVELPAHLPCDPVAVGDAVCAEQWLRELLPRAYRQPAAEADVERLLAVYTSAAADDGFAMGVQVTLQTVLQSPLFLYHVERGEPSAAGGPRRLTGHELAARLSYFLWNSMPDEALLQAAAAGELSTDTGLRTQVDRMLIDPKADAAIADFHLQWLGLDELETLEKNTAVYPEFDADLARAMKDDTASFVRWVFNEGDGRLPTLLTGAFTLSTDPALLALYGVELPADHVAGTPLPLPADERGGVLTQPAVMARHGHADQSSPVHRGQLVRENLLCMPLPPPPPDVDNVPPEPKPGATTRERFEQHNADPACAACHTLIDGIGFGFEHYDGIGAFRAMDEGLPVDASGELVASDVNGEYYGALELGAKLAASTDVRECVARQWLRYSLGRLDTQDDECATEQLVERFGSADDHLRTLVHEVVQSDAFRYRRSSEDSAVITEGE
jgi:hypothetical protein